MIWSWLRLVWVVGSGGVLCVCVCVAPLLVAAVWFGGDTSSFLSSKTTRHYYRPTIHSAQETPSSFLLHLSVPPSIPPHFSRTEVFSSSLHLNIYSFSHFNPLLFLLFCGQIWAPCEFVNLVHWFKTCCQALCKRFFLRLQRSQYLADIFNDQFKGKFV